MKLLPYIPDFKNYFWKKLLPAIIIVAGGILFLNFFLAYRLENYLRKEIGNLAAQATDGFYKVTYEDLSIHLLNGELTIEGLHIEPDSAIFSQWQKKDSLPFTYVKANIPRIDFTGINLIWIRDYRRLAFNSFEINAPRIEVFDAFYSDRHFRKVKTNRMKTLHELIEPYIDVLQVSRLNVTNASASFLVEHPFSPILYSLENASFHAERFRLDSASYDSGKLLYSDEFEFATNQPQTLIRNNSFLLQTDSILVSTKDSIVFIGNTQLLPREELPMDDGTPPESYFSGKVGSVAINGIGFSRYHALNHLKARSFKVGATDLYVYRYRKKQPFTPVNRDKSYLAENDSLTPSLSLYEVISPFFESVAIEEIDVRSTTMDYLLTNPDTTESVQIRNLVLYARHFLVDSLSEDLNGVWYAKNIRLQADRLAGFWREKNHRIEVDSVLLDSKKEYFQMLNIGISPLTKQSREAMISGTIPAIRINQLKYEEGVSAGTLLVQQPDIQFTTPVSTLKKTNTTTNPDGDIFTPLFQYIQADSIRLRRANISFTDRRQKDYQRYKLNNLELYANRFRMDEETVREKTPLGFTCEELGFKLNKFNNKIGNNNLQVGHASYSNKSGILAIDDIRLTPPADRKKGSYLQLESPGIRITGMHDLLTDYNVIEVDSVLIRQPRLTYTTNPEEEDSTEEKVKEVTPFNPFRHIDIKQVSLDNTEVHFNNKTSGEALDFTYDWLSISQVRWNMQEDNGFHIQEFSVHAPAVEWSVTQTDSLTSSPGEKKTISEMIHPYAEKLVMDRFYADMIKLNTKQPYMQTALDITSVEVDSLYWSLVENDRIMKIGETTIRQPEVTINRQPAPPRKEEEVNDTIQSSLYDQLELLADQIAVDKLTVDGATLDFTNAQTPEKEFRQKLNETDFSIEQLELDNTGHRFSYEDIQFRTRNLSYPINNGFYDLKLGYVELKDKDILLEDFHMVSPYGKYEFAYLHPEHQDWFDVRFDRVLVKGIDLPGLFTNQLLTVHEVIVDNPAMENFKNKQIFTPPRYMPMVYEGIQKAPIKMIIDTIRVNNFEVIYEELAKKATEPGFLQFTEMNGVVTGFTNIVSRPDQFIRLDADGLFYGQGHCQAVWLIPVDSLYDRFILEGYLPDMDLTLVNAMITPMASARLKSGHLDDFWFRMDASSLKGDIELQLLYSDLKADIFKTKNGEEKSRKLLNLLVNAVIRDNNPNKPGGKPRRSDLTVIRDPYHSSFNYWWQLLRPALTESVGISQKQQKTAAKAAGFFTKVKNLFTSNKKEEKEKEKLIAAP